MEKQFNPNDYPNRLKAIKQTKGNLSAQDALFLMGIDRCPECRCAIGEDTKFKDFSNKTVALCAQCGSEMSTTEEYLKRMAEEFFMGKRNRLTHNGITARIIQTNDEDAIRFRNPKTKHWFQISSDMDEEDFARIMMNFEKEWNAREN